MHVLISVLFLGKIKSPEERIKEVNIHCVSAISAVKDVLCNENGPILLIKN